MFAIADQLKSLALRSLSIVQVQTLRACLDEIRTSHRFCGLAPRWNANVRTMVLPRAVLTAEEVAAAVGQQATCFRSWRLHW